MKLEDVKPEHLWLEKVIVRARPSDYTSSCVRMKNHKGKCQCIRDGMTQGQAEAITAQDLM